MKNLQLLRERKFFLDGIVQIPEITRDQIRDNFLNPPLYNKDIHKNFVTLYGVQYDLENLSATVFLAKKNDETKF